MPIPRKGGGGGGGVSAPAPSGGIPRKARVSQPVVQEEFAPAPAAPAEEESNIGPLAMGAAAGGGILALLGGIAAKNPSLIGKGLKGLGAIRMQSMLTGMAPVKSVLGNLGAGVERVVEGKGTGALKEMFSRQMLDDIVTGYKTNAGHNPSGVNLPGPMPGRIMGAFDSAAQKALQRGGASADEAENAVLQSPLQGDLAKSLDSPLAQYVFPFRRSPMNSAIEGGKKIRAATVEGDKAAIRGLATYGTVGAAHGYATADDKTPMSVPLGMAASARYGLPYGFAALLGRTLAGGKTSASGIAGSMLPVSEYGVESALHPVKSFEPAILRLMKRLSGEK